MKEKSPDKAEQIICLFSDVVYEQVLRSARYLKLVTKNKVFCFHCQKSKMVLMGLDAKDAKGFDFSKVQYFEEILKNIPPSLSVIHSDKKYNQPREKEIFSMLEKGAEISDGSLFKAISLLHAQVNEL